jgi:hypothetical protein
LVEINFKTQAFSRLFTRRNGMTRYSMTICAVAALVLAALMTGVGGCGRTETTDKPEKPTRSEKKLQLARDGEALYAIVRGKSPSEAENLAAKELGEYLKKITGAEFPVATEGAALPKPHGIYLGWTEFATAQGIKPETLGEEEWVLRTAGDDLILTGGRRRGTLYAVYEFLERDLGCHWLAWDCEVVPSDRNLAVSSPNKNGKPAFSAREIYIATERFGGGEAKRNYKDMRLRNRSYLTWQPEIGGYLVYPPGRAHTFYQFLSPKKWFETHPEYFSMDAAGKRTCGTALAQERTGASGSNLCLSNLAVVREMATAIAAYLKSEDAAKYEKHRQCNPYVVDVGMEDNAPFICKCPECTTISQREGGESGLLVSFLNQVAELLEKDFPGIQLRTLCYVNTDKVPKTVRPRDNVIVWWCDLYGKSDPFRPLTHVVNKEQIGMLRDWTRIGKNVHVWDYWDMGSVSCTASFPEFVSPRVTSANLRLCRDLGVKGYFCELEMSVTQQSFRALSEWAGMQMLNNPDLPEEELIDTFIKGYYGVAAPAMRRYYDYLENAMLNEPTPMYAPMPATGRKYLTHDFLVNCRKMLQEAQEATAPDSRERLHVWRELVVVDNCLLHQWERMKRVTGKDFPFPREKALDEYEKIREAVIRGGGLGEKREQELLEEIKREITVFRVAIPLPEQFKNIPADKILDFPWTKFAPWTLFDDPEAAGGRATCLPRTHVDPNDPKSHANSPVLGLYDRIQKRSGATLKLSPEQIPSDEKYHIYKVGHFRLGPDTILWGHASWHLSVYLAAAFVPDDGLEENNPNEWDVYVSTKIVGPAYVKDSKKENNIWIDRVILVRHEK